MAFMNKMSRVVGAGFGFALSSGAFMNAANAEVPAECHTTIVDMKSGYSQEQSACMPDTMTTHIGPVSNPEVQSGNTKDYVVPAGLGALLVVGAVGFVGNKLLDERKSNKLFNRSEDDTKVEENELMLDVITNFSYQIEEFNDMNEAQRSAKFAEFQNPPTE